MGFSLIRINDVDSRTFAWPFKRPVSLLPPAAVFLDGRAYRVSNFCADSDEYLFKEVSGPCEAIEISLSFYGDITFPELAFLAVLADKLGAEPESLSVFRKKGVKGRRNFDILKKAALLPENILSYAARREIPLKTAALLASFSSGALRFIESRLACGREPSVGEFIKFVNDTADFKELAENAEYSSGFRFPERVSPKRAELEAALKKFNGAISPASVRSADFFETGDMEFLFKASSAESFGEAVRKLAKSRSEAEVFYEKLKKYDIR